MEDSLREFELGVLAEEKTVKNLEALTRELPHHFDNFGFPPTVREASCQAQDVGYGNWMEHENKGWASPPLNRFLFSPDLRNPKPKAKVHHEQLNNIILEILSERVAHSLSRDFADADEEQINTKPGKKKSGSSWAAGGNASSLADPWMVAMMEKVREDKVQQPRLLAKLSAARNMNVMGEPVHAVSITFPEFVIGHFVKGGFRHLLGDFIRSLADQVASNLENSSPRVQLFWRLCQLDSSDYIKDATANRLFATLALATREFVNTNFVNTPMQRHLLKEIVDGRFVLSVWKESSKGNLPQIRLNWRALEMACRTNLSGLTQRRLNRISAKAFPKGAMEQHSSKRQVDLDIYSFELASEMQIQEDQQIWAFTRLYWRLQRRCAPRGVVLPSDTRLIEVPPHLLEESICLFTGIKCETFFYHMYAQSVLPAEPGDRKGTFNQMVFVRLLLHHNINLARLVAGLSFMFHVESWKNKLRAEGKLGIKKTKEKKGKGHSASPRGGASPMSPR